MFTELFNRVIESFTYIGIQMTRIFTSIEGSLAVFLSCFTIVLTIRFIIYPLMTSGVTMKSEKVRKNKSTKKGTRNG